MKFQTTKKDPSNRGDEGLSELKTTIISTWLGMRDSNPRSWDQNPVPYRLANPQRLANCNKKRRVWPEVMLQSVC